MLDGFLKIEMTHGPSINFWVFDISKWVVLPAMLMFVLHRTSTVLPREYGLSADLGIRDILGTLPLTLFTLFFVGFMTEGFGNLILGYPKPPFSNLETLSALGRLWIVGTFYFSVSAGFCESIFFIGLPWLWVSQAVRMSLWQTRLFAVASALLFGLAHWENGIPSAMGAFAFQLLAIWWYMRLKTLWPIIASHILIDLYYFWPQPTT